MTTNPGHKKHQGTLKAWQAAAASGGPTGLVRTRARGLSPEAVEAAKGEQKPKPSESMKGRRGRKVREGIDTDLDDLQYPHNEFVRTSKK